MRRVRWSLSGPHRTRSGTPVAVAVKQRGNFAQRSDRDARRHLPSPSDGSPLTHCGVVTACSSTATDGSRCSCRSTTPRSIQLKVKFGIRIVGAGSRGPTGTVNPNRSGRDAPTGRARPAAGWPPRYRRTCPRAPDSGRVVGDPRSVQDVLHQHEIQADAARRGRPERGHGQDAGQGDARDQPAARQRFQAEDGTPLSF